MKKQVDIIVEFGYMYDEMIWFNSGKKILLKLLPAYD